MADKDIKIGIGLDAKGAEQGLGQLADKAEDADKAVKELDGSKVTVDATSADRDIDGLLQKVDKLGAEPAKILLQSNAEAIAIDIVDLLSDIDKLDAADPTIEAKFDKVNELSADLDRLKGKAVELGSTPIDLKTSVARQGIDDIGRSADSSKSVLANMVGNSTQDIAGLGGVAGTAGVAIGQMGEYMADALSSGEGLGSVLKNFGKVAGPLVGIGVAVGALSFVWGKLQDAQKKAAEEAKKLLQIQEALAAGETDRAAQALVEQYEDLYATAQKLGVPLKDLTAFLLQQTGAFEDGAVPALQGYNAAAGEATEVAARLGISVDEAKEMLNEFVDSSRSSRQQLATSNDTFAASAAVVDEAARGIDSLTVSTEEEAAAAELAAEKSAELTAAVEAEADAHRDAAAALIEKTDAQRDAAAGTLDLHDAERDWAETLAELPGQLQDVETGEDGVTRSMEDQTRVARENDQAISDATRTADDLAQANVDLAQAQFDAAGVTLTQAQRTDIWNSTMANAAAQASGPLRTAILNHIAAVNDIPTEKMTEIEAAMAAGDIDEVNRLLADASRTRTSDVIADAHTAEAENDLNQVARTRTARIHAAMIGAADTDNRVGGGGAPGWGWDGPRQPGVAAAAGNSYTVNINTNGVGANPVQIGAEVAKALKAFEAVNGPLYATVNQGR